jgi:hypothetical protein
LVIIPDSPERLYSTRLRTAVVLTGSGTAGAYHAGVLRALHEAGVRTDLVAGRGMGAAAAMFAAVDGGARLWDASGIWKGRAATRFYQCRSALRVAGWALVGFGGVLLFPLVLFAAAIVIGTIAFLLTLIGFDHAGSMLTVGFTSRIAALFMPSSLPTTVPRLALFCILVGLASLAAGAAAHQLAGRGRRRIRRDPLSYLWRLVGGPLSTASAVETFASELWKLIKGAAPLQRPRNVELGRRFVELLSENLGQPGFRELLIVFHDLDARHDVVLAFLGELHRPKFFGGAASVNGRGSEVFDLSGVARDHALDGLAAALVMPIAAEPHLVTFAAEGPWRGETHRMCDRPGALARLLDEVAAAGVEQVILVSASPRSGRPHELNLGRTDMRGLGGEQLAAFESAGLRDAVTAFAGRFSGLHVVRPEHNPLGPLDFAGTHDERSDRRYTLAELVDRGYEDAYRQFIDPVVGEG